MDVFIHIKKHTCQYTPAFIPMSQMNTSCCAIFESWTEIGAKTATVKPYFDRPQRCRVVVAHCSQKYLNVYRLFEYFTIIALWLRFP